nr:MAG TPA: hypothetical protein [Bacteriophage sp.]
MFLAIIFSEEFQVIRPLVDWHFTTSLHLCIFSISAFLLLLPHFTRHLK